MKIQKYKNQEIEPGIYSDMPNQTYHAGPGYSSSVLKIIAQTTLKHAEDSVFLKTDAMSLGTQLHDAIELSCKGKTIFEKYIPVDSYAKNNKSDIILFFRKYYKKINELKKMASATEEDYLHGREKISQENLDQVELMLTGLKEHPTTAKLLQMNGIPELSFFYEYDVDGKKILVKVRPDLTIELDEDIILIDWKTISQPATDRNIRLACYSYRYDIQAALYRDLVSSITGKNVFFNFVFIETIDPCKEKIRVVELFESDMISGIDDCNEALKTIASNDEWKGYQIPESGVDTIYMRGG
jgi:exodeoxyribonuclease VIII